MENNKNKIFEHISETMIHKTFVINACLKMSKYLISEGEYDLANSLMYRANIHDNSKLVGPELELFTNLYGNQESFVNPKTQLTDYQRKVIEKHWENNRHHPEHFENFAEMSELDIIEMSCDWYARSVQYGTDFMNFIKTRQEVRFHFPNEVFEKILKYCSVLNAEET